MQIVDNFFNKLVNELDSKYFPDLKYFRDDDKCAQVHYNVELFNNGCITYNKLITVISTQCNETRENIEQIVDKYIMFDEEEFKRKQFNK